MQLALYLDCHHGVPDEAVKDARLIQRVSVEKHVPVTYNFSGYELTTLQQERDRIQYELWCDVVGAMQSDLFINPRSGNSDPHKPELGIMPFHHMPLVQPWGHGSWGNYFDMLLRDDVQASIRAAEHGFYKTPVTMQPPDGVYAPAAAHALRSCGIDTVVVSGEFLGDNRGAKGGVYWASGLRHLMRTNDVQPQAFEDTRDFVDAAESYAYHHYLPTLAVGCDIDEFNGMRGRSLHDGIVHLCHIADEAYRRGVPLVNCNAAAHLSPRHADIEAVWPWNDVHAMIRGDGNLGWLDAERNALVGYVIDLAARRRYEGWDVGCALGHLRMASDIALRNKDFCYDGWLTRHFDENVGYARRVLQG